MLRFIRLIGQVLLYNIELNLGIALRCGIFEKESPFIPSGRKVTFLWPFSFAETEVRLLHSEVDGERAR